MSPSEKNSREAIAYFLVSHNNCVIFFWYEFIFLLVVGAIFTSEKIQEVVPMSSNSCLVLCQGTILRFYGFIEKWIFQ